MHQHCISWHHQNIACVFLKISYWLCATFWDLDWYVIYPISTLYLKSLFAENMYNRMWRYKSAVACIRTLLSWAPKLYMTLVTNVPSSINLLQQHSMYILGSFIYLCSCSMQSKFVSNFLISWWYVQMYGSSNHSLSKRRIVTNL